MSTDWVLGAITFYHPWSSFQVDDFIVSNNLDVFDRMNMGNSINIILRPPSNTVEMPLEIDREDRFNDNMVLFYALYDLKPGRRY
jgi:hypothetical protein